MATTVIDAVANEPVVFNPRRTSWDSTWKQTADNPEFVTQVNWELDRINEAQVVFFYFQEGTRSPMGIQSLKDEIQYWTEA